MTGIARWCLVLLTVGGCAAPQVHAAERAGQDAPAAALTQQSSIDDILDALDARGDALADFTADVALKEQDAALGDSQTRQGQIWYQKQADGDARIRVLFTTRENEQGKRDDKIEYVLDDGWLWDRDYQERVQVKRQVLKPGEKIDLLKLGEGPFPLPLGQAKEDVHKAFEVKKIDPNEKDPPGTVHVQLVPKQGTQFADKFHSIDVWVDLEQHMPQRIETLDANEATYRTTELKKIQVNTDLGDDQFKLSTISVDEWRTVDEAFE